MCMLIAQAEIISFYINLRKQSTRKRILDSFGQTDKSNFFFFLTQSQFQIVIVDEIQPSG